MRILHLNEFYAPVGGLERYLDACCAALEADGHTTAVLYATATGREPSASRAAYHVPALEADATGGQAQLEAVVRDEKPDVVMVHQVLNAGALDWITGAYPSVRFAHGFKVICPGGRRMWRGAGQVCRREAGYACQAVAYRERCMPRDPRAGLPLVARSLRLAAIHRRRSEIVVASGFMRELFLANRFDGRRVHVVPYFTDLPPAVTDVPPGRTRLFCAARLVPEKGLHLLLDALRRVPGAELTIAGDGPERARLKGLAALGGLADRVAFTGWLEPDAVARAIAASTAVVVPSLWPEPFGITGIEAMAHARPVIAFDVGGVREWLVDRETGLAVAPGDAAGLAAAIERIGDRELATRLGRRGRACVETRFTARAHVDALLRVVRRAHEAGVPA